MFSPKKPLLVPPTLRLSAPYCSRDILSPLPIRFAAARRPRSSLMSSSKFTAESALKRKRDTPPFSCASNLALLLARCFLMRAYASDLLSSNTTSTPPPGSLRPKRALVRTGPPRVEEALDRPAAGALSAARSPETAAIEERAMADMLSDACVDGSCAMRRSRRDRKCSYFEAVIPGDVTPGRARRAERTGIQSGMTKWNQPIRNHRFPSAKAPVAWSEGRIGTRTA